MFNLNSGYADVRLSDLTNSEADAITNTQGERLDGEMSNNGHTAVLYLVTGGDSDGISAGVPESELPDAPAATPPLGGPITTAAGSSTPSPAMYPMEMHIVHVKVDEADPMNVWDGLAVVGQMFEISEDDNAVLTPPWRPH